MTRKLASLHCAEDTELLSPLIGTLCLQVFCSKGAFAILVHGSQAASYTGSRVWDDDYSGWLVHDGTSISASVMTRLCQQAHQRRFTIISFKCILDRHLVPLMFRAGI